MKKYQTLILVWLCLLAVLSSTWLSGCNGQTTSLTTGTSAVPSTTATSLAATSSTQLYSEFVTEPGKFPVVTSPQTLKFFAIQPAIIEDFTTNELTKAYETKSGVKIEWEVVPQNAGAERRKISLVSGDYPDVYIGADITKEEEIIYGSQGIFIPLNDLIDIYTIEVKKAFDQLPQCKEMSTTPDGNIYSLPNMNDCYHALFPVKFFINTTWLTTLGLNLPTTTEELYLVFKAFKENDPNSNGKKDEIPFFAADNKSSSFVLFFMNSFIECNRDNMFADQNGKVDVAFNKPEWREGLRYLKKLTDEGLIDIASYAATSEQVKQIAESPTIILGSTIGIPGSLAGTNHKNYDPLPPVKGPQGMAKAVYHSGQFTNTGAFVITSNCTHPEVAIRWIDYFFSLEGALSARIGREGIEWRKANQGEPSYTGKPALWGKITAIGQAQNFFWAQWNMAQFMRHSSQTTDPDFKSPAGVEGRYYDVYEKYLPYAPKYPIPPLYISSEDIKVINQPLINMKNYVQESIVRFITGDLDLDKDWDAYVDNIKKMDLESILSAYQNGYSAYIKVIKNQ